MTDIVVYSEHTTAQSIWQLQIYLFEALAFLGKFRLAKTNARTFVCTTEDFPSFQQV